MLRVGGWQRSDFGRVVSWDTIALVAKNAGYDEKSAMYRYRHPTDWWFGMTEQFLAAVLHAVQSGNWQRGGGKGSRPKLFEAPKPKPKTAATVPLARVGDELAARRARIRASKSEAARGSMTSGGELNGR